jgi:RNA recognition motif-containing protein
MSVRLYVGNLPAELDRQALEQIFNESGESVSLKIITDRKTGKCRGFGFVTVETSEVATAVIEKFNGFDFNGSVLKLEMALPRNSKTEDTQQAEAAEPVRNVPKPSLRSARFDIQTDVEVKTDEPPVRKESSKRKRQKKTVSQPASRVQLL